MNSDNDRLILFFSIVDFGKGSKALKLARRLGGTGGTILLGKGTVRSGLLNILGLWEVRKEVFVTIIDGKLEDEFYNEMSKVFHLNKAHHGIAFSIPLKSHIDINGVKHSSTVQRKGGNKMDYEAIFTIVDKGLSDDVLDAARAAGSTGGTIIHGRGSGTREREKLFDIEIEPEKDVILILSQSEKTNDIVDGIKKALNIENLGAGIIFVSDVNRVFGLYGE